MAIERPLIYPLDCIVLGDVESALPKDADRRVLHFWGYRRDEVEDLDSTQLCFVDYYVPPQSSLGATVAPIYHEKKLQYLGLRTVDVDIILQYFRMHFTLKVIASQKMAFTAEEGLVYKPVLTRWPESQWYFLSPTGTEGVAGRVMRDNIWTAWQPLA